MEKTSRRRRRRRSRRHRADHVPRHVPEYAPDISAVEVISFLYLVAGGVLACLAGVAVVIVIRNPPLTNEDAWAAALAFILLGALAAADIFIGLGLRRFKLWVLWIAVTHSVLNLLAFPCGTVLGFVKLYFLMRARYLFQ